MGSQYECAQYWLLLNGAEKGLRPHEEKQGIGGSMVFRSLEKLIYAGKNARAYSTAKAAETHLARCIAAEGALMAFASTSVLPMPYYTGSAIWNVRLAQRTR